MHVFDRCLRICLEGSGDNNTSPLKLLLQFTSVSVKK